MSHPTKMDLNQLHNPEAVASIVLELLRLRSRYVVSKALAELCPTTHDAELLFQRNDILQALDRFVMLIEELNAEAATVTDADVWQLIGNTYPESLEAVAVLCEALNVPAEAMMSVLVMDINKGA